MGTPTHIRCEAIPPLIDRLEYIQKNPDQKDAVIERSPLYAKHQDALKRAADIVVTGKTPEQTLQELKIGCRFPDASSFPSPTAFQPKNLDQAKTAVRLAVMGFVSVLSNKDLELFENNPENISDKSKLLDQEVARLSKDLSQSDQKSLQEFYKIEKQRAIDWRREVGQDTKAFWFILFQVVSQLGLPVFATLDGHLFPSNYTHEASSTEQMTSKQRKTFCNRLFWSKTIGLPPHLKGHIDNASETIFDDSTASRNAQTSPGIAQVIVHSADDLPRENLRTTVEAMSSQCRGFKMTGNEKLFSYTVDIAGAVRDGFMLAGLTRQIDVIDTITSSPTGFNLEDDSPQTNPTTTTLTADHAFSKGQIISRMITSTRNLLTDIAANEGAESALLTGLALSLGLPLVSKMLSEKYPDTEYAINLTPEEVEVYEDIRPPREAANNQTEKNQAESNNKAALTEGVARALGVLQYLITNRGGHYDRLTAAALNLKNNELTLAPEIVRLSADIVANTETTDALGASTLIPLVAVTVDHSMAFRTGYADAAVFDRSSQTGDMTPFFTVMAHQGAAEVFRFMAYQEGVELSPSNADLIGALYAARFLSYSGGWARYYGYMDWVPLIGPARGPERSEFSRIKVFDQGNLLTLQDPKSGLKLDLNPSINTTRQPSGGFISTPVLTFDFSVTD